MALVKCPECEKEISDSVTTCPHCGYALKLKRKRGIGAIIAAILIVLGIGGFVVYSNYIKPQQTMNEAENLIARGRYSEADVLLASVPASSRKSGLLTAIGLKEAEEALTAGNYLLAEEKLAQVPEESITQDIRKEINVQRAKAFIGQGRYLEADALYAELEQTDDIKDLRTQYFYESRVHQCALMTRETLIYPESIIISEAIFVNAGDTKDEMQSTSEKAVFTANQPSIVLHYQAKTRGGNLSDGYVRFVWKDGAYSMMTSVDSLTTDDKTPYSYDSMSVSEKLQYLSEQMEISSINLVLLISKWDSVLNEEQLSRINLALKGSTTSSSEIIPNNDVVPSTTPRIVEVTPEPTTTPVG